MLINVDRNLCIGAAPCVAIAGDVFQLDDEGKAIVIGPSTDDANTQLAAEACPVRAIFLYSVIQIYPDPAESPRDYAPEPPNA
jgi:ferredoxin